MGTLYEFRDTRDNWNMLHCTQKLPTSGENVYWRGSVTDSYTTDDEGFTVATLAADGKYNYLAFYLPDRTIDELDGATCAISMDVMSSQLATSVAAEQHCFSLCWGAFTKPSGAPSRRRYKEFGVFDSVTYGTITCDYKDGEWCHLVWAGTLPRIEEMLSDSDSGDYEQFGLQIYSRAANTEYPLDVKKVKMELGTAATEWAPHKDEVTRDAARPAEAMQWNGEYLEDKVTGYRTLYTAGREVMESELTTYETGVRDGSVLQSKRYPARYITVGFRIMAEDDAAFRKAFNKLNGVLKDAEGQMIFEDEQGKYFTGTLESATMLTDAGSNKYIGELVFLCSDPFKYSVDEIEVEPDENGEFILEYGGTYPAHPTLEADFYDESESSGTLTGLGDCGFVAFFDQDGHIILLGDTEEEDIEQVDKSQTLICQSWDAETSVSSVWERNKGSVTGAFNALNGSVKVDDYSPPYGDSGNGVMVNSYGTAGSDESADSSYHGTSLYREIPTDANGELPTDWKVCWELKMSIGEDSDSNLERGNFELLVHSDAGETIAGVQIFKGTTTTNATMRMYVAGQAVKDVTIDLSYRNTHFGTNKADGSFTAVKYCSITKAGTSVKFCLGGDEFSFSDSSLESSSKFTTAVDLVIAWGQKYDYPTLARCYLKYVKFIKNNCQTFVDIPNKFSANDIVIADCKTGEVLYNGSPSPELGALGNDWETFVLTSGINQIGTTYSSWLAEQYAPTFKLRYREVYI